jgi:RHS repeat-associated protein
VAITIPTQANLRFSVTWAGIDTGSGLRHYEVQVKAQGEIDWTPWLTGTTQTSAPFRGQPGQSYLFRVRATDNVNNISDWVESGPVEIVGVTKYYHFGGQRVAMRQGDVVYYLHGDHLGSVSLTTDSAGRVVAERRYLPYGQERWSSRAAVTDFGFTGQRNEVSFGLMDYQARYYSPYLGWFISADTIVLQPTNYPYSISICYN